MVVKRETLANARKSTRRKEENLDSAGVRLERKKSASTSVVLFFATADGRQTPSRTGAHVLVAIHVLALAKQMMATRVIA